jgi:N-carbamoylputrescine amidase
VVASAGRDSEEVVTASFDLAEIAGFRAAWGLVRARRPELYGALGTLDGRP